MTVRYLSVCSGIEAATVAWEPLGWQPVAFSEVESFPRAVLQHHYPGVPLFGDFTAIRNNHLRRCNGDANVDVLVGGTPCQSFSVAGLRKGMDDPRGNLSLAFVALVRRTRTRWVVWENVRGVLSIDAGNAFASLLSALSGWIVEPPATGWKSAGIVPPADEHSYGIAWRVLDAQYFGLAQRRKRVFVVAYLGDWRPAAAVLFEPESLRGDSAPGREEGERVARPIAAGSPRSGGYRNDADTADNLVASHDVAQPLLAKPNCSMRADAESYVAHTLTGEGFDASEDGTGKGTPLVPETSMCLNAGAMGRQDAESETLIPFDTTQVTSAANYSRPAPGDPCHPLAAAAHAPAVAFDARQQDVLQHGDRVGPLDTDGYSQAVAFQGRGSNIDCNGDVAGTIGTNADRASGGAPMAQQGMSVRRLTPRECERLQGFPDDWTLIPTDKARAVEADWLAYIRCTYPDMTEAAAMRRAKDGPRYKVIGNSMAVPCMRWIGRRIEMFEREVAAA